MLILLLLTFVDIDFMARVSSCLAERFVRRVA